MFEYKGKDFYLDSKKFQIRSGAMHYFRIPHEYWEDRLLKLKAAGLNTVETYVAWNVHEPRKGEFCFDGNADLVRYITMAQQLGLKVIVRPGPYICAEWDFGGFPAWLLAEDGISLRCYEDKYIRHVREYFEVLLPMLVPLLDTNGGPIIAMQVENEYGSYGSDKKYLRWLRDTMRESGIDVMLFTSDGESRFHLSGGGLPEELMVVNFGSYPKDAFGDLMQLQPDKPLMCGEQWCGWFEHWGENRVFSDSGATKTKDVINQFFDLNASFNLYMFHGGTNFGFGAGANYNDRYCPTVTCYDYGAPLSEYGGYTEKYRLLREAIATRTGEKLPEMPPEPELQSIGKVSLTQFAGLKENISSIGTTHKSNLPYYMEKYGQSYGMILYKTEITGDYPDTEFSAFGIHDLAYVWVNGKYSGKYNRSKLKKSELYDEKITVPIPAFSGTVTVEILVAALGRVNFSQHLYDRKGMSHAQIGGQLLYNWEATSIPLDNTDALEFNGKEPSYPMFMRGSFKTDKTLDCFVNMRHFSRSMVWINGFNLGRYLKEGPERTLYLPGTILKKNEDNEIIVLELEKCTGKSVEITDTQSFINA